MSTNLQPIFQALGFREEGQQLGLVKLLQASGAYGQLPGVDGMINDSEAQAILNYVSFPTAEEMAQKLHKMTQAHMLRPAGTERWDSTDSPFYQQHRAELVEAAQQAGLLSGGQPQQKQYKHALLLGATQPVVDERLDTIKKLWDEGVRFEKLHLLGSDRPLLPEESAAMIDLKDGTRISTEMEMMIARYAKKSEHWPEELKNIPLFLVNTPDQVSGRRANTRDTIETWRDTKPEPGSVLAISSAPHVAYQDAAIKSVLPASFSVDTVGDAVAPGEKISVVMDALARRIDVGLPKLLEALKAQPVADMPIIMLDPKDIKVDAKTYQFRSKGDGNGVTEKGRIHAEEWDPRLHGNPILVHPCMENGVEVQYLVDGHHRLELARTLNAQGKGPSKIAAIELRGVTKQEAKLIAAVKNIVEQSKTLQYDPVAMVDAARVVKEINQSGIDWKKMPKLPAENNYAIKQVVTLSGLSDESLRHVEKGEVPVMMAAEVVARVPTDRLKQDTVMRIIRSRIRDSVAPPASAQAHGPVALAGVEPDFVARLKWQREQTAANSLSR